MARYNTCITTKTIPNHLSISRFLTNKTWTPPEQATQYFPEPRPQSLRGWSLSQPPHTQLSSACRWPKSPTEHIFWISDQKIVFKFQFGSSVLKTCVSHAWLVCLSCCISGRCRPIFLWISVAWRIRIELCQNIYPAFQRMGKRFLEPRNWTYVNWFIIFCRCGCMCAARVKIYAELGNSSSNIIKWRPYLGGVFHGGKEPRTHAFSLLSCALR